MKVISIVFSSFDCYRYRRKVDKRRHPCGVRLIGYKVTVRNRIATINFITTRNSRLIASTRSSEKQGLASFIQTLIRNSRLNINEVRLAQNGTIYFDNNEL